MLVDSRKEFIVEVSAVFLELGPRKVTQIVVSLTHELLSVEESVDEEAAAGDLPRQPAVET